MSPLWDTTGACRLMSGREEDAYDDHRPFSGSAPYHSIHAVPAVPTVCFVVETWHGHDSSRGVPVIHPPIPSNALSNGSDLAHLARFVPEKDAVVVRGSLHVASECAELDGTPSPRMGVVVAHAQSGPSCSPSPDELLDRMECSLSSPVTILIVIVGEEGW